MTQILCYSLWYLLLWKDWHQWLGYSTMLTCTQLHQWYWPSNIAVLRFWNNNIYCFRTVLCSDFVWKTSKQIIFFSFRSYLTISYHNLNFATYTFILYILKNNSNLTMIQTINTVSTIIYCVKRKMTRTGSNIAW